jgi:rare lipoprotein A
VPGKHAREQSPQRQVRTGYAGPVASAAVVAALLFGGAVGAVKLNHERTGAITRTDPAATESVVQPTTGAPHGATTQAAPTPTAAAQPSPTAVPRATATPEHASRGSTRTAKPTATPSAKKTTSTVVESGSCGASFYDEPQATANGETFDPEALTAANKEWAFNTRVRVTNPDNGKSVTVRINDRGPYVDGRCIDLSRAAFRAIADLDLGEIDVKYEVLK